MALKRYRYIGNKEFELFAALLRSKGQNSRVIQKSNGRYATYRANKKKR